MRLTAPFFAAFPPLVALSVAACASPSPTATGPAVTVDATCEGRLETIVGTDVANSDTRSLALGPDGTLYFLGGTIDAPGTYALDPSGGAPRKISSTSYAERIFVDGDQILEASGGHLYAVPIAGGDAKTIGRLPGTETTDPLTLAADSYALDADFLYVGWQSFVGTKYGVSRIARKDGHVEPVFATDDEAYQSLFTDPLAIDGDTLYGSLFELVFRVPKSGGTPEVLGTGWAPTGPGFLSPERRTFYGQSLDARTFQRAPLDALDHGVSIDGLQGVVRVASDATATYASFIDQKDGRFRMALTRVPDGDEHVTASACTELRASVAGQDLADIVIGPKYVYAIVVDYDSPSLLNNRTIVRVAR